MQRTALPFASWRAARTRCVRRLRLPAIARHLPPSLIAAWCTQLNALAVSTDGSLFVTGGEDRVVKVRVPSRLRALCACVCCNQWRAQRHRCSTGVAVRRGLRGGGRRGPLCGHPRRRHQPRPPHPRVGGRRGCHLRVAHARHRRCQGCGSGCGAALRGRGRGARAGRRANECFSLSRPSASHWPVPKLYAIRRRRREQRAQRATLREYLALSAPSCTPLRSDCSAPC